MSVEYSSRESGAVNEIQIEFKIMLDPVVWSKAYTILKAIMKYQLLRHLKEVEYEQYKEN